MAEQKDPRDNTGALFKNDRKAEDKQPDLTGHASVDGKEFWVSAWRKSGQNGDFYSLSFRAKDAAKSNTDDLI